MAWGAANSWDVAHLRDLLMDAQELVIKSGGEVFSGGVETTWSSWDVLFLEVS